MQLIAKLPQSLHVHLHVALQAAVRRFLAMRAYKRTSRAARAAMRIQRAWRCSVLRQEAMLQMAEARNMRNHRRAAQSFTGAL